MKHKFAIPAEQELEILITQVFESMPAAEQSRLSLIESRLKQKTKRKKIQKKLNQIPWWIVLILAGGFATAAWWADEVFFDNQKSENTHGQSLSSDKISERDVSVYDMESNIEDNKQQNESYEDKDSPIIYQRESY